MSVDLSAHVIREGSSAASYSAITFLVSRSGELMRVDALGREQGGIIVESTQLTSYSRSLRQYVQPDLDTQRASKYKTRVEELIRQLTGRFAKLDELSKSAKIAGRERLKLGSLPIDAVVLVITDDSPQEAVSDRL